MVKRPSDFAADFAPSDDADEIGALIGFTTMPPGPSSKPITLADLRTAITMLDAANTRERREADRLKIEDYLRKRYPEIYGVPR